MKLNIITSSLVSYCSYSVLRARINASKQSASTASVVSWIRSAMTPTHALSTTATSLQVTYHYHKSNKGRITTHNLETPSKQAANTILFLTASLATTAKRASFRAVAVAATIGSAAPPIPIAPTAIKIQSVSG